MSKPFDPTEFTNPNDVAYELARVHGRIRENQQRRDQLDAAILDDEAVLGHLDRWMLAIFEASPRITAIRIDVGYALTVLTPGEGFVYVHMPEYTNKLNMVDFPIEPDYDQHDIVKPNVLEMSRCHVGHQDVQPVTIPARGRSITEENHQWSGQTIS